MELTTTWSLIAAGSALLLVSAGGRLAWPRQRFWLALTRAATRRELHRIGKPEDPEGQTFESSLRNLGDGVSHQQGTTPTETKQFQLDQTSAQSTTLAG